MTRVVASISLSLDGYAADERGGVAEVFAWMAGGDVAVPTPEPTRVLRTGAASAARLREAFSRTAAVVCGRRLFDLTGGWGGVPPAGRRVVVVTHRDANGWVAAQPDAPFSFRGDLAEAFGLAAAEAGAEELVALASPDLVQQALRQGLADELHLDLVPVLLGRGLRYFGDLDAPVPLSTPRVVQGSGVTHLAYDLRA